MQKHHGRSPETDSFMWLFRSGEDGLAPIILYHYTENRAKYNAAAFLNGFQDGYLEDGHCSLSNNLSENAIRPFTVGRKNWLFSSSPKGAEASSLVYSMVEMAKANGLNFYRYLEYLLKHRPNEKMTDEQLSELALWSDSVKASCQEQ